MLNLNLQQLNLEIEWWIYLRCWLKNRVRLHLLYRQRFKILWNVLSILGSAGKGTGLLNFQIMEREIQWKMISKWNWIQHKDHSFQKWKLVHSIMPKLWDWILHLVLHLSDHFNFLNKWNWNHSIERKGKLVEKSRIAESSPR